MQLQLLTELFNKLAKGHNRIMDSLMKINVVEDVNAVRNRRRRDDRQVTELRTIKENIGNYSSMRQFFNDLQSVIVYGRAYYAVRLVCIIKCIVLIYNSDKSSQNVSTGHVRGGDCAAKQ